MQQIKFNIQFVDNGAILSYDDGMCQVVQSIDDKVVGAFIGEDIMGAINEDCDEAPDGYDIEITIKTKK